MVRAVVNRARLLGGRRGRADQQGRREDEMSIHDFWRPQAPRTGAIRSRKRESAPRKTSDHRKIKRLG
jgi:hypothetical protein